MRLCSQIGYLSVPNFQPVVCVPDAVEAMDLETISRSGSSNSDKAEMLSQDVYVPINYMSPEVYALLAAAEASAARRADTIDVADMQLALNGQGSTLQTQSAHIGWNYLGLGLSSTAPPKRFYTTFWQSISLRLLSLEQGPCEGSMPSRAGLHPTPEVD